MPVCNWPTPHVSDARASDPVLTVAFEIDCATPWSVMFSRAIMSRARSFQPEQLIKLLCPFAESRTRLARSYGHRPVVAQVPPPKVTTIEPVRRITIPAMIPVCNSEIVSVLPRPAKALPVANGNVRRRVRLKNSGGFTLEAGTTIPCMTWVGAVATMCAALSGRTRRGGLRRASVGVRDEFPQSQRWDLVGQELDAEVGEDAHARNCDPKTESLPRHAQAALRNEATGEPPPAARWLYATTTPSAIAAVHKMCLPRMTASKARGAAESRPATRQRWAARALSVNRTREVAAATLRESSRTRASA